MARLIARSPGWPSGRLRAGPRARCSRTSACSSGWARAPTSSARRCTTSRTRAAATSRCAPRAPRRWSGPSCSTGRRRRGRSGTPPRPSATSARRPAATASTTRSASRRSARPTPTSTSRSSSLGRRPTWPRSACAGSRLLLNSMGDARRPGPLRRRARRPSSRDRRGDLADGRPGQGRRRTRCGCSTRKRPATAGGGRRRAPHRRRTSSEASTAHFDRVQAGLDARSASPFTIEPRLVRGLDYYTHTTVRVPGRGARAGPEHDRRRRPLRRAGRGARRAADARHRLRLGHRAHPAGLRRRGRVPGARPRRSTCSSSTSPAASAARDLTARAAPRRAPRRPGLRRPVDEVADEGGRPVRRPARRSSSASEEAADGTVTVRDLAPRRAGRSSPRDQVVDAGPTRSWRHVTDDAAAWALRTALVRRAARRATSGGPCRVCGWVARRREHGEHLAFVDLRDHTGVVQCVVDGADDLRSEYVVRVTGTVRRRPEGTANPDLATGEVEVGDCEVEVLVDGRAAAVPGRPTASSRRDRPPALPLRRPAPRPHAAQPARSGPRSTAPSAASMERAGLRRDRDADAHRVDPRGRPRLRRAVPPAARAAFYALPQSPQLFKQLCMVGGIDRYFQIARCLRDEDLRADRQFEFMQLDIEASFVGQDDVLGVHRPRRSPTPPRRSPASAGRRRSRTITWHDAMERFGSDKPDIRFGMELVELTEVFAAHRVQRVPGAMRQGHPRPGRRRAVAQAGSTTSPTRPSGGAPRAWSG